MWTKVVTFLFRLYPFKKGRYWLECLAISILPQYIIYKNLFGARFLLNSKNYIDREILLRGGYEDLSISFFKNLIATQDSEIFIDVGAAFGLYTLSLVHSSPRLKEFLCFEPDSFNRAHLYGNIFLNHCVDRINVFAEALSSVQERKVMFFQRDKDLSTGLSSFNFSQGERVEGLVNAVPLDSLLHHRGRRIAIKMDIEGHEIFALKGMTEIIKNNLVLLQVEIFSENLEQVSNFLTGMGMIQLLKPSNIITEFYFTNVPMEQSKL